MLGTKTEMLRKKLEEQGTTQTKRSRKVVKHKQAHKQKQHSLKILLVALRRLSHHKKKEVMLLFNWSIRVANRKLVVKKQR